MSELKVGQKVSLTTGSQATIIEELGRGGQGIVYRVKLGGEDKALKWYHSAASDAFYKNLVRNANNGAPSPSFIWPEFVTNRQEGSFGYIMKLRPKGYYDFSAYLNAAHRFSSFTAMMRTALKICEAFKLLHLRGYSYQDLNDGNFFVRPQDGDVLICDNDNVSAQGTNSGILGKANYMAPEVVLGKLPDKYSDRFSLAVILFLLFFNGRPFDGAKVASAQCLTPEAERTFYGENPVFVFDPQNSTNRPVKSLHGDLIRRWPVFPPELKLAFIQEFSEDKLKNPTKRMLETEWEKVIRKTWDKLVNCHHCHTETFVNEKETCMECGHPLNTHQRLVVNQREMILTPGTELYIDGVDKPDAQSLLAKDGRLLLLKNLTKGTWNVETPSGKVNAVESGAYMPVKNGLKISFGSSMTNLPNAKGQIVIK